MQSSTVSCSHSGGRRLLHGFMSSEELLADQAFWKQQLVWCCAFVVYDTMTWTISKPNLAAKGTPACVGCPQVKRLPPLHASRRDVVQGAASVLLGATLWHHGLNGGPAQAKPVSIIDVEKAGPGERDVSTTSTGLKFADVSKGTGQVSKTGDLVLVEVVGSLKGGQVFIDTRKLGAPLAFQIGTTNKYIPEGLSQAVEGMSSGSVRLAVLPPSLGYGEKSVALPGATVPPNSTLYYEVELLRCETVSMGLACCTEKVFTGNDGTCLKRPAQQ